MRIVYRRVRFRWNTRAQSTTRYNGQNTTASIGTDEVRFETHRELAGLILALFFLAALPILIRFRFAGTSQTG